MLSKPAWAEIEQIFYYSIPGSLLIFYTLGFFFAIGNRIPLDGAFLAAVLLASIPFGFIAYQAFTSNLLWIYGRIWNTHDKSEALNLVASKLPKPTGAGEKQTDLAKRILIVIGNEKDASGYRWKLLNLANSRGVCTFASVASALIPIGWTIYRILSSYVEGHGADISFLTANLLLKLSIYYILLTLLGASFYRAIPKILRQLDSYSKILVARNPDLINEIAAGLKFEYSDAPQAQKTAIPPKHGRTVPRITSILSASAYELATFGIGAVVGAIMNALLNTRGLEPLAFGVLLIPAGTSLVLGSLGERVSSKFNRLAGRFLHWFLGGTSGAFMGLLITGGPGLYAVNPTIAIAAIGIFLAGMLVAVILPNIFGRLQG
jgi:hypothetical protein